MKIIIFSFNRAAQLSALLSSIVQFVDVPYRDINVIYNTTDKDFQKGYDILQDKYSRLVSFIREQPESYKYSLCELFDLYNLRLLYLCPFLRGGKTDFRKSLLGLLASTDGEVMFLTDDSIFIDQVSLSVDLLEWLHKDPEHRQISLRTGKEFLSGDIKVMDGSVWSFADYSDRSIWGYRYSLDAHIYDCKEMYKFLKCATFKNPNTLESVGLLHANKKSLFELGRNLGNVKILSYPINIVQTTFNNEALHADVATLNEYFINGYELELPLPEKIIDFQVYPETVSMRRGEEIIELNIKGINC